jgi:hypothetical protein
MPDGHATWLTAAACTMAPARATRFNDLPPQHRKDLVRLGFLSAVAVGYTIAICILAQPIPSRSLHTHVALPHGAVPRSPLIDALLVDPPAAPRTTTALRTSGRSAGMGLKAIALSEADEPRPQPRTPRRGNVFSRFFKGVWRTVS